MTHEPDRDEVALRALLAAPHLDEGGFAARVTSSLPARARRRRLDRRTLAIAGGTLAAAACGALGAGALETTLPFGAVGPLAVVVVALVWGLVEGTRAEA